MDKDLSCFRDVVDSALYKVVESGFEAAKAKGLDGNEIGHIISASLLHHSFFLLIALADGDVSAAAATQISDFNMLVDYLAAAEEKPN